MRRFTRSFCHGLFGISLSFCVAVPAFAQATGSDAQYEQDIKDCASLPEESRAACRREAAAARQERRKGASPAADESYRLNRVTRCDRLPAAEREACLKLMSDRSKPTVHGSVQGGGVLREITIETPAPPSLPENASTPETQPVPAIPLPVEPVR